MIKMNICPACGSVQEAGGVCSSRCGSTSLIIFDIPATAIGNPLESRCGTMQQLIAANLTLAAAWTWKQELMTAEGTRKRGEVPRPFERELVGTKAKERARACAQSA